MRKTARFSRGYILKIKDEKAQVILLEGQKEEWIPIPPNIEDRENIQIGRLFAFVETEDGYRFGQMLVQEKE